jgi:hypothetical protein
MEGATSRARRRRIHVFATAAEKRGSEGPSLKDLQAKIGQLAMENEWKGRSRVAIGGGRCHDA